MSEFENQILVGDVLERLRELPDRCVQTCVTSPPYWGLRDYGVDGQIGLEKTIEEYVERLVAVFREVRRVLRDDGTLWLNLGDAYANDTKWGGRSGKKNAASAAGGYRGQRARRITGLKPKNLMGMPWRVAFALQADGWYLRSDIIWSKTCSMPESVKDRPTKTHEYVFLMSKSEKSYCDMEAIREPDKHGDHPRSVLHTPEPSGGIMSAHTGIRKEDGRNGLGRNRRTVWEIPTQPYPEAHFATFPEDLPVLCILAGSPKGGVVLDPFIGSGTTAVVARKLGRKYVGIELNPEYAVLAVARIRSGKFPKRRATPDKAQAELFEYPRNGHIAKG